MLLKACPTLASLNIKESLKFYLNLGFEERYQDDNYLIMKRDNILLHFWKCKDKIHPQNTSCYVFVDEIESLYAQMQDLNVVHPNSKLEDTPYHIREFAILDVHGNLIRFGQNLPIPS